MKENIQVPKVFIIVLNWNGIQDSIECIESLLLIDYTNYEILFVDNNSTDNSSTIIKKIYPTLKIIQNNANLGFAGGNNVGIKYALDNFADYILLLNNDTTVDKYFLNNLINTIDNDLTLGIVGAANCFYDREKTIWQLGGIYRPTIGLLKMPFANTLYSKIKESILYCDYVPGSSLLIRASIILEIGLLDEEFFNQCEDLDWCLKTKNINKKVACVINSVIYHKVSRSTPSTLSHYFFHRNMLRIHSRYCQKKIFIPQLIFLVYSIIKMIKYLFSNRRVSYSIWISIIDHFKKETGIGSLHKILNLSKIKI